MPARFAFCTITPSMSASLSLKSKMDELISELKKKALPPKVGGRFF